MSYTKRHVGVLLKETKVSSQRAAHSNYGVALSVQCLGAFGKNSKNSSDMATSNNYLVIMAGGIGSRFWPISTTECPKQFIDIFK